jgi:hypothetical protein
MRTAFLFKPTFARLSFAVVLVTGLAACSQSPTTPTLPFPNVTEGPSADITPRWNALARHLIVAAKPNQQEALRMFAYLSLAQHEAALEIRHAGTQVVGSTRGGLTSESTEIQSSGGETNGASTRGDRAAQLRGAIAGASAEVLSEMFKSSGAAIAAALDAEALVSVEAGEIADQFQFGVTEGRATGARIVAAARVDNFDATWDGVVPAGPGKWFSSIGRPPALPMLGKMKPFFMTTGADFRPGPPPVIGSQAYLAALAEIRNYSDTRTSAQDSTAKFWAMATGPLVAGYWNEVATALIEKYHLTESRATHVLALMNTAAMDGNIACHDAKYTYWMIRPSQADADIKTAIGLPNHPSYPSNHACLSGTAALILANEFPAERAQLERQAEDATVSRYYAGLHYRFDGDSGLAIARKVAALAVKADRDLNGKLMLR